MFYKKIIIMCTLLMMTFFAGCSEDTPDSVSDEPSESISTSDSVSDETSEIITPSHIHTENTQLCMDKLMFVANLNHNYELNEFDDSDIDYYFVVFDDGNIYTMENNYQSDNYEFLKKFASRDDSAWELADNLENIGSLSPEDTELLSGYISGINPDSDYYDYERDNRGELPEVIESTYYNYRCYIPDGETKSSFKITNGGEEQGAYYKTYDENAISALKLVTDNQLYIDWRNNLYEQHYIGNY